MNTFTEFLSQKVIKARFRSSIGRVALTLQNGDVAFLHPNALEEAFPFKMNNAGIMLLAGATCQYQQSKVVAGEEFTWTGNESDEHMIAKTDLTINNVLSLYFEGANASRGEYFAEKYVPKESDDAYDLAKATKKRSIKPDNDVEPPIVSDEIIALIDTIDGATTLAELKEVVEEHELFEDHVEELLAIKQVKKLKQEMKAVISSTDAPF